MAQSYEKVKPTPELASELSLGFQLLLYSNSMVGVEVLLFPTPNFKGPDQAKLLSTPNFYLNPETNFSLLPTSLSFRKANFYFF